MNVLVQVLIHGQGGSGVSVPPETGRLENVFAEVWPKSDSFTRPYPL